MHNLFIGFLILSGCFQSQPQSLEPIDWLTGKWMSVNSEGKQTSYEAWQKISDTQFSGISYSVASGDTSVMETLEISERDGDFYYVADVPQNPAPVWFKITEMSDSTLIAENPQHDFPKRIEYRRENGKLQVEISAGQQGRIFHFEKQED